MPSNDRQHHRDADLSTLDSPHPASGTISHASPQMLADGADCDAQLRTGLDLIQAAYHSRTAALEAEVAHYRQVAAAQRARIQHLEAESTQLHATVADLDAQLSSAHAQAKVLRQAKHALADKYAALKQTAAQLDAFRRNILHTIETANSTAPPSVVDDLSRAGDNTSVLASVLPVVAPAAVPELAKPAAVTRDTTVIKTAATRRHSSAGRLADRDEVGTAARDRADRERERDRVDRERERERERERDRELRDRPATSGGTAARRAKDVTTASRKPDRETTISRPSTSHASHAAAPNSSTTADAQSLYRKIRDALSPEDFAQFASTINAFNSNKIGVDETIQRVDQIVADRQLFVQMRALIYRALAESSQARSTSQFSTATAAGGGGGGGSTVQAGVA
ncbi:hypothetical protein AMAG_04638 [Allomyces macrogynus ATCC 38327]|uniref:At4g15545-like C-terminal domain-containing protein n=1 Tax=Allomyces macrogynus (strain ATCC 38327) TaxID=578462 RepID=A0A0L0S5K2_ALLM3|nr:hypothetical protein AMAG_04638 [Allomyces macrogynus ATCC 38327]|eukprot:KNE57787.1 hypothetical protein AMAG_04638 [Allomyces macrogynus ATCC 38327]